MPFIDKLGLFSGDQPLRDLILDVGCGPSKFSPTAIGVDISDFPGVDIVGDVFEVLSLLPDRSVKQVYCSHFCEHISDLPLLLKEIRRILEIDGIARIIVPHFSNPFFYSDPTHRQPFGLYTFSYFCIENIFKRRVPSYARVPGLRLNSVHLVFKSVRPRYCTHLFRKTFELLFNLTNRMKEIYEDSFSWLLPCYEIQFVLVVDEENA